MTQEPVQEGYLLIPRQVWSAHASHTLWRGLYLQGTRRISLPRTQVNGCWWECLVASLACVRLLVHRSGQLHLAGAFVNPLQLDIT